MSKFAEMVYAALKRIFPYYTIVKEYYVNYKNTRLYFDFYIRELNIFFEVQGAQHSGYNKHFHGDRNGYLKSRSRDNLKKEWIEKKDYHLIEIFPGDKIYDKTILNKIYKQLGYKTHDKRKRRKKPYNNPNRQPPKRTS
jgi:hypothetical protein